MSSGPRLWAISDLHVSYPQNAQQVARLRPSHPEDWLIVAGDVAERTPVIMGALEGLSQHFAKVIWVPGNHELWTSRRTEVVPPSTAKYADLVAQCRRLGIVTPEDDYPLWTGPGGPAWVAPLFLPYDYTWLVDPRLTVEQAMARAEEHHVVAADVYLIDPSPFSSIEHWSKTRVHLSQRRLAELDAAYPTVLVNHWPLVREPTRWLRHPEFAMFCGTEATAQWHRRFRALACVYGHLHMPVTFLHDGVRFEECSMGYPREWQRWGHRHDWPRQILPAPGHAALLGREVRSVALRMAEVINQRWR